MSRISSYVYSIGLQYQEDLKIRAQNDVTARKDKEHLEVKKNIETELLTIFLKLFYLFRK